MPWAPPRHCPAGHPPFTGSRCPLCAAARDKLRGTAAQRGYDDKWRSFRAAYLRRNPVCCVAGCGQPATEVDHIRPLREGGGRFDAANLRPTCKQHHSRRTMADQGPNRDRGSRFCDDGGLDRAGVTRAISPGMGFPRKGGFR